MYCPHCGKETQGNAKFCSKCGKVLDVQTDLKKEKKPRPLIIRIISLIFLLFVLPTILVNLVNQNLFSDEKQSLIICIIIYFFSIIIPITLWSHLLKKFPEKKKRLHVIFSPIMLLLLVGIVYSQSQLDYMRSMNRLAIIQNYLVEATAAKLMGDSIMSGHPVGGVTFADIANTATMSAQKLTTVDRLSLARKLDDYDHIGIHWINEIADSAKNTRTWKNLPGQPADFKLSLTDTVAKDWFKTSVQNIQTLKEFGDTAIKNKDKTTMLYIAAKLLVQKHWLNGILYAQKVNLLSFKLADKVMARACAPGESSFRPEDCDPATGICTQRCTVEQPMILTQPPVQQNPPPQTVNENPPEEPAETETPAPTPYTYDSQPTRDTCIGTTSGSYCAQATMQSVNEIVVSAIGFAEDQPNAEKDWDDSWHELEAMGEISPEKTVATPEHSPRVQAFYNDCTARGSFVGGANQNKGRLPTTESGYHCNYKQGVNNCWDFLTYSGGRFMGGDVGCQEKNLVPLAPNKKPAQQAAQPATQSKSSANQNKSWIWEGTYPGNQTGCNVNEVLYAYVKNNQVSYGDTPTDTTGGAGGVSIGSDGHAVSKYTDENGAVTIENFQFTMKGNVATVVRDSTYNDPSGKTASCGPFHFEGTRK